MIYTHTTTRAKTASIIEIVRLIMSGEEESSSEDTDEEPAAEGDIMRRTISMMDAVFALMVVCVYITNASSQQQRAKHSTTQYSRTNNEQHATRAPLMPSLRIGAIWRHQWQSLPRRVPLRMSCRQLRVR